MLCDLALASSGAGLLLATGNVEGCIELWAIRDGVFQQLPADSSALGGDAHVAVIDPGLEDPLLLTANAVDGTLGFLTPLSDRAGVAERWPAGHTHPITAIAGVRHRTGDILIASGDRHGDVLLCRSRADGTDPRPISRLSLGARILDIHLAPDGSSMVWSSQGGLYLTLTPDPTRF
ncbi:hypothetical protein [Streptomyces sp. NPDC005303]|uniref:hypothetical protein n=1 Tax=Streptomyces sp. NPDC005303 TaxID=3155713 RepID=UPI0033B512BC